MKDSAQGTYKISHSFKFDTASHASGSSRLFYLTFVCIRKIPEGIVGVAKYPEIISAYIR